MRKLTGKDSYCTDLQVGSRVGSDGTVLFKTGNGDDIQMAYVAYSPTQGIVVGHQGEQQERRFAPLHILTRTGLRRHEPLIGRQHCQ